MPNLKQFADYEAKVKGRWFEDILTDVVKWGLVKGYPDGEIKPDRWGESAGGGFVFPESMAVVHRQVLSKPQERLAREMLSHAVNVWGRNDEGIVLGSGVWLSDWRVVTNAHVVSDPETYETLPNIGVGGNPALGFSPMHSMDAEVLAVSHMNDLAVLSVEKPTYTDYEYVPVTEQQLQPYKLNPGQEVWAVGRPFGRSWDVADGVIRNPERWINVWKRHQEVYGMTIGINPGNSGGGVFDLRGNLIGIANAGFIGANVFTFCIPIEKLIDLL